MLYTVNLRGSSVKPSVESQFMAFSFLFMFQLSTHDLPFKRHCITDVAFMTFVTVITFIMLFNIFTMSTFNSFITIITVFTFNTFYTLYIVNVHHILHVFRYFLLLLISLQFLKLLLPPLPFSHSCSVSERVRWQKRSDLISLGMSNVPGVGMRSIGIF